MQAIKSVIAVRALAGLLIPAAPTDAAAVTCYAGSRTGSWGWGRAGSLRAAQRRALYECAVRTPRGYTCYITRCG